MTENMLAMIYSDAILNANDTRDEFESRLAELQAEWMQEPVDRDDHLGIALTLLYDLLTDEELFSDFEKAYSYIIEGRIDSLTYYYDWDSFDVHDEISEIRYHIDEYIGYGLGDYVEPANFVILIKEIDDQYGAYVIGEGTEFAVVHITVPQVVMITNMLSLIGEGITMIGNGLSSIYGNLQGIFILDLDPSKLDFSHVESDSDIILILETSNPEFLSLTSYGVEQFHKAGDWFEQAFEKLGTFFDQMSALAFAIAPYDEDFGINGEEFMFTMWELSEIAWWIQDDFANPDSTIIIDGERVNLSAWFDNPPQSFLMMWKNYVFGVDSTLGGLFPDRYVSIVDIPSLPGEFCLYPVYPNPFNPVANIVFDLPKSADVKLTIVNLKGEKVEELINQRMKPGSIKFLWDASRCPSGIYFALLEADGKISVKKMTLIK
jgi:hypothetical protein